MSSEEKSTEAQRVVIFELGNIAIGARSIIYDVIENVLADKGVKMNKGIFVRFYKDGCLGEFIEKVLEDQDKTRLSSKKLIEDIEQGIRLSLTDSGVNMVKGLQNLLEKGQERGFVFGAVSNYDNDLTETLVENLGLKGMLVEIMCRAKGNEHWPVADTWTKLINTLNSKPQLCLAITTGSKAFRSAISAGAKCVVVPDDFTGHQDFGGADFVVDSLDDAIIEQAFSLLDGN